MSFALPTFGAIQTEIEDELDLEDEIFIDDDEFISYFNDAVTICEGILAKMNLFDKYFKAECYLALTNGSQTVQFMTDAVGANTNILGFKIERLVYSSADRTYTIDRMVRQNAFEDERDILIHGSGIDWYMYDVMNPTQGGTPYIKLIPQSRETSTTNVKMLYVRKANRMTAGTDSMDIPYGDQIVKKYVIWRCLKKEGHPSTAEAKQDYEEMKEHFISTLSDMTPDGKTEMIEADLSIYRETS